MEKLKTIRQQRYPKIVKPDWDYSKREWVEQGVSKKNTTVGLENFLKTIKHPNPDIPLHPE